MQIRPPAAVETESLYLGLCLKAGIVPECKPGDFYADHHREICSAMFQTQKAGESIDLVTVGMRCLSSVVTVDFLHGLTLLPEPDELRLRTYRDIILKHSVARRLQRWGYEVGDALNTIRGKDLTEYLGKKESEITALFDRGTEQIVTITEAIKGLVGCVEERFEAGGGIAGLETGFSDLDRYLCGFCPSDLVVLAARPSMGKTAFALDVSRHVARHGAKVLFISLEMSERQLAMRMSAQEAGLNVLALRSGQLSTSDMVEFHRAAVRLSGLDIVIEDSRGTTETGIAHLTRRHRPGLLVVDYAGLVKCSEGGDRHVNRERQIAIITGELKSIAKTYGIPVLLLSQLNREIERQGNREPMLSDLRESGALEQDADAVLFLHAKDKSDPYRDVLIAKNRMGPLGRVRLAWLAASTSFRNFAARSDAKAA